MRVAVLVLRSCVCVVFDVCVGFLTDTTIL